MNSMKTLLVGYVIYIVTGWIILSLPFSQQQPVSPLDNLFTATSAVSTTGLATVSTPGSYTLLGEAAILVMIQFGGIGYMTLGSFILLARRVKLPDAREEVARASFVLPEGFEIRTILRNVVIFSAVIETLGAIGLYFAFRAAGVKDPLWQAIFHSISAFSTAGFSLFNNGLADFADNFWVISIISVLSLLGAIGFLVLSDFFLAFTTNRKRRTLTTKIILHATCWTLVTGWVILFLIEPSFNGMPPWQRLMAAGFQSMTALTTVGFNTVDIGGLSHASSLLVMLLMILGASPSGTGGGLKSTTVSAAFATVWSTLRARKKVTFWGCEVPQHRLLLAFASVVFYIAIFFAGGLLLLLVQPEPMEDVLFEAASALGTVGVSRGLTAHLTPVGKILIIALMFIGRLGPVTFGLALLAGKQEPVEHEDLAV